MSPIVVQKSSTARGDLPKQMESLRSRDGTGRGGRSPPCSSGGSAIAWRARGVLCEDLDNICLRLGFCREELCQDKKVLAGSGGMKNVVASGGAKEGSSLAVALTVRANK